MALRCESPEGLAFVADQRGATSVENAVGCKAPHSVMPLYVQFSKNTPSELRLPRITCSMSLSG